MLLNGAAVEEVLLARDVLAALPPGALVIDMSSIPPQSALGSSLATVLNSF